MEVPEGAWLVVTETADSRDDDPGGVEIVSDEDWDELLDDESESVEELLEEELLCSRGDFLSIAYMVYLKIQF